MGDLVTIYTPQTELEARLVEDILSSEGIPSVVRCDEFPMYTGITYGCGPWGAVLVRDLDAERATEVIELTPGLGPDVIADNGEVALRRNTTARLHLTPLKYALIIMPILLIIASVFNGATMIGFFILTTSIGLVFREVRRAIVDVPTAILLLVLSPLIAVVGIGWMIIKGFIWLIAVLRKLPETLRD